MKIPTLSGSRLSGLRIVFGTIMLAASICGAAAQEKSREKPQEDAQASTHEEQGMDSAVLAKLVAYATSRNFDSLLITRHGKIVLDAYYAPYTADPPHVINSATKAVIGAPRIPAPRPGRSTAPRLRC